MISGSRAQQRCRTAREGVIKRRQVEVERREVSEAHRLEQLAQPRLLALCRDAADERHHRRNRFQEGVIWMGEEAGVGRERRTRSNPAT
eukprot:scaffold104956_cov28-Tisochrysis_lutea.AAC.14